MSSSIIDEVCSRVWDGRRKAYSVSPIGQIKIVISERTFARLVGELAKRRRDSEPSAIDYPPSGMMIYGMAVVRDRNLGDNEILFRSEVSV